MAAMDGQEREQDSLLGGCRGHVDAVDGHRQGPEEAYGHPHRRGAYAPGRRRIVEPRRGRICHTLAEEDESVVTHSG